MASRGAAVDGTPTRVHVSVRVRPLTDAEADAGARSAVRAVPSSSAGGVGVGSDARLAVMADPDAWRAEEFAFDRVHGVEGAPDPPASAASLARLNAQERLHRDVGAPAVRAAWEGYDAGVVAVGAAGSGKTHAMRGAPGVGRGRGLVPRIAEDLFARIDAERARGDGAETRVEVTAVEVYRERARDLLAGAGAAASASSASAHSVHSVAASSLAHLQRILANAEARRDPSTRAKAHAVTRIALVRFPPRPPSEKELELDDDAPADPPASLSPAAREKDRRARAPSLAAAPVASTLHLVEIAASTHGRDESWRAACARAADAEKRSTDGRIPPGSSAADGTRPERRREEGSASSGSASSGSASSGSASSGLASSALTRHMGPDLIGGNAKAWVVACASPAEGDVEETLATFRFAASCRASRSVATIGRDADAAEARDARKDAATLRARLEEARAEFAAARAKQQTEEQQQQRRDAGARAASALADRRARRARDGGARASATFSGSGGANRAGGDQQAETAFSRSLRLRSAMRDLRARLEAAERRAKAAEGRYAAKLARYTDADAKLRASRERARTRGAEHARPLTPPTLEPLLGEDYADAAGIGIGGVGSGGGGEGGTGLVTGLVRVPRAIAIDRDAIRVGVTANEETDAEEGRDAEEETDGEEGRDGEETSKFVALPPFFGAGSAYSCVLTRRLAEGGAFVVRVVPERASSSSSASGAAGPLADAYVNGEPVGEGGAELRDGDRVVFGKLSLAAFAYRSGGEGRDFPPPPDAAARPSSAGPDEPPVAFDWTEAQAELRRDAVVRARVGGRAAAAAAAAGSASPRVGGTYRTRTRGGVRGLAAPWPRPRRPAAGVGVGRRRRRRVPRFRRRTRFRRRSIVLRLLRLRRRAAEALARVSPPTGRRVTSARGRGERRV